MCLLKKVLYIHTHVSRGMYMMHTTECYIYIYIYICIYDYIYIYIYNIM